MTPYRPRQLVILIPLSAIIAVCSKKWLGGMCFFLTWVLVAAQGALWHHFGRQFGAFWALLGDPLATKMHSIEHFGVHFGTFLSTLGSLGRPWDPLWTPLGADTEKAAKKHPPGHETVVNFLIPFVFLLNCVVFLRSLLQRRRQHLDHI